MDVFGRHIFFLSDDRARTCSHELSPKQREDDLRTNMAMVGVGNLETLAIYQLKPRYHFKIYI